MGDAGGGTRQDQAHARVDLAVDAVAGGGAHVGGGVDARHGQVLAGVGAAAGEEGEVVDDVERRSRIGRSILLMRLRWV